MSQDASPHPDSPQRVDATVQVDYLDARRRKRELLEQADAPRPDGTRTAPEELLDDWPSDPAGEADAASLLFEDFCRRRDRGDEPSLSEYEERFPQHRDSLADLMRRQDFVRSLGVISGSGGGGALRLPEVGEELFGFRLRGSLGRGAFARVYLAEQVGLAGRPVVLKVSAIDGDEPQTLAQLQHTNIVPIYSVHEDAAAGIRAVCMPYFGGASLSAVVQRFPEGRRPASAADFLRALGDASVPVDGLASPSRSTTRRPPSTIPYTGWTFHRAAAWVVARLAEGLQHAHDRGVLHRDVKPSNVLIDRDGLPLLLDFNLAHDVNKEPARAKVGGTVAYMAPEHLRALAARDAALVRLVDRRADVYSLGMVLFEVLTGESPFDQSASYTPLAALIEAMALERSRTVPSLRQKLPDVAWGLESIARKCLAPDAAQRYQRAADLAEDLDRFLNDLPLKYAPELSLRERAAKWLRRHPRVASSGSVGTAAAVLLLCTLGTLAGVRGHLAEARDQLEVGQANDLRREFEGRARAAMRFGETGKVVQIGATGDESEDATPDPEAPAMIRAALDLYGAADRDDWQERPAWRRLDPDSRRRTAEDVRELLLLLAWARAQLGGRDRESQGEALALLDRAAAVRELGPSPAVLYDRAAYLEALGRGDEARAAREEAKRTPPVSARDHYQLARSHSRGKRTAEAIAEVDRALALDPRHHWSWCLRGLLHAERGEHTLAAADFSYCLGEQPEAWLYFNRGFSFYVMGYLANAVQDYDAALRLEPEQPVARWNRGLAHLGLANYDAALADFEASKGAVHDEAFWSLNVGTALEGLGRAADADAAFAAALDLIADAPAKARTLLRCRYALAVTPRHPDRAARAFLDVIRAEPENATALYGLGAVLVRGGEADAGLARLDQAIEAEPEFLEARRFRAVVLARKQREDEALRDINFCLKKESEGGMTLYAAACVMALLRPGNDGMAGQALKFLRNALDQGYGRDRAADDEDLRSLRGRQEFRDLLRGK
jgi:serine/threonine protein kinase/tetratricopeptide (TPR) repeat protein